jgi:hypothetical protein
MRTPLLGTGLLRSLGARRPTPGGPTPIFLPGLAPALQSAAPPSHTRASCYHWLQARLSGRRPTGRLILLVWCCSVTVFPCPLLATLRYTPLPRCLPLPLTLPLW